MKDDFSTILQFDSPPKSLIQVGEKVFYKKNEMIVCLGDILEGFYYVKKGRVVCIDYSTKGNEKIEFIMEEKSTFLESTVIFDLPVDAYFKAIEDCELIKIKKEDIMKLLKSDYEVTLFILKSITNKFYASQSQIKNMIFFDTEWRVCKLFLQLVDKYGKKIENKIKLDVNLSGQFISDILGINRITTVRIIKKLKSMNLLEQTDGYYYIKDLDGLKKYQSNLHPE
jgi:CRP/FNR family transcriptional regulator